MTTPQGPDIRIDQCLTRQALARPNAAALESARGCLSFAALENETQRAASRLMELGLQRGDRVAIFLEKRPEAVVAILATARAGGIFIPVNPALRQRQVAHILSHSAARVLVTSSARLDTLQVADWPDTLEQVLVVDHDNHANPGSSSARDRSGLDDHHDRGASVTPFSRSLELHSGDHLTSESGKRGHAPTRAADPPPIRQAGDWHRSPTAKLDVSATVTEHDPVAILYTSGSTGAPKGVLLSHRNLLAGAESVAGYLRLDTDDRIMAALPFSFDYGLNQVLSSLHTGACCRLTEYLSPAGLLEEAAQFGTTTLAGVPTLWQALARETWPEALLSTLRRMTNTGGRLPEATVRSLRERAPETRLFLMYGLTEAFRSTYLPPELVDQYPSSIGRAVPNAELAVVRADGTPCAPGEEGELVHRGAFVALGYWNDPAATAARFRPWPLTPPEHPLPELAVWSGDRVVQDEQGLLYFAGRGDDMIKTSGYRVSPTEVETVLLESAEVITAAAFGVADTTLGQAIAVIYQPASPASTPERLQRWCRKTLPGYMQPRIWITLPDGLPHTPHGKIDRNRLRRELEDGTLQPAAEPHGTRT
ncbi:AMP-binding protein [Thioalkalivibrio sp. ALJT]|uniref:AMP-binding protein n=1 Tax=Thioalkalivibrio sp. ALJT TaxID=1158146 RepID=UPI00039E025C|nr:AMP-binding protein [Thioalkalivibrio sp. ALJT]